MSEFFNPEKGLWSWLSTLVDLCGLSILWIFLCLPVVTAGPATAALYFAVVTCVRKREGGAFRAYFRSLGQNFRTGLLATLIVLAAALLLVEGYRIMRWYGTGLGGWAYMLYIAYHFAMLLPAGVACWLFPLLGRFDYNVRDLFAMAFRLAVSHLPSTVVVTLLTSQAAVWCVERWWPVLFMPAAATLLISLFLERIFRKYSPELREAEGEPENDLETESE